MTGPERERERERERFAKSGAMVSKHMTPRRTEIPPSEIVDIGGVHTRMRQALLVKNNARKREEQRKRITQMLMNETRRWDIPGGENIPQGPDCDGP